MFFQRRDIDGQKVCEKVLNVTIKGNANQCNETTHLSEWLLSKRQQITSVREDVEKREPLCTAGWNVNWGCH